MHMLRKLPKSDLDTAKITAQVRKSLRVLFPDSNSAGDFEVKIQHNGLLLAPRITSSVAITSDFYFKVLSVLEVALWPAVQLQHPFVMQLKPLEGQGLDRSRAFFFPWMIGASQRLRISEVQEVEYAKKKNCFHLMSNIDLPITQHIIVSGQTGSGKSYLLRQLLGVFSSLGDVILVDPKLSDGARWAREKPGVELIKPILAEGSTGSTIGAELLDAVNDRLDRLEASMYARQEKLYKQAKVSADFHQLGVKPIYLVIDELAVLTIGASRKAKDDFFAHLTRLSLLAREAGIVIVLALQQARAESLPTAVRAQMGVKILLGPVNKDQTQYLFPNLDQVPFLPVTGPGIGLLSIAGSRRFTGILPIATPTLLPEKAGGQA